MALLVLIMMGATIGWLASIITRTEHSRDILRMMAAGTVSALVVGLAANGGTFLGGLTFLALALAFAASVAAVGAIYWLREHRVDA
ncbi:hypothetical protein [Erythrobacter sp. MTPC3]|uniref:hypothetical protein n=1 Tax=Erythrobacter sp. MTPC3 TaxID=3056564 RepID=UPI0036F3082B